MTLAPRNLVSYSSLLLIALLFLPASSVAAAGFVRVDGPQLLDPSGHPLLLRGTSLGNWLVQEGYMFHFEGGPQSAREIEALTHELLGPEAAAKFWREYRERYVTRDDIQFLKRTDYRLFGNIGKNRFGQFRTIGK